MVIQKKAVPLHPQIRRLGYGVMVTLQILVLPFLVRVRVPQLTTTKKGFHSEAFFISYLALLSGVLGVDGLDLVAYQLNLVLELLDLAVHLVDERASLL